VQPPFACDYGYSVLVGNNAFINFNAMIFGLGPAEDRRRHADRDRWRWHALPRRSGPLSWLGDVILGAD
jgi:hypothetical protein